MIARISPTYSSSGKIRRRRFPWDAIFFFFSFFVKVQVAVRLRQPQTMRGAPSQ